MADWPEHSSELARKALDTLHRAAHSYGEHEMSEEELRLVCDTITDTTQGLVPNEVTDLILKVRKGL